MNISAQRWKWRIDKVENLPLNNYQNTPKKFYTKLQTKATYLKINICSPCLHHYFNEVPNVKGDSSRFSCWRNKWACGSIWPYLYNSVKRLTTPTSRRLYGYIIPTATWYHKSATTVLRRLSTLSHFYMIYQLHINLQSFCHIPH